MWLLAQQRLWLRMLKPAKDTSTVQLFFPRSFQDAMAGVLGVQNLKNPLLKEKDKNKEKRLDLD